MGRDCLHWTLRATLRTWVLRLLGRGDVICVFQKEPSISCDKEPGRAGRKQDVAWKLF